MAICRSVAVWAATRCGRVAVPSAPTLATIFSITSYARFELLGEPLELLGGYKISHSDKIHLSIMHLRSGYYRSDGG